MLIPGILGRKLLTLSLAICQFRRAHFSISPAREVKFVGYNRFRRRSRPGSIAHEDAVCHRGTPRTLRTLKLRRLLHVRVRFINGRCVTVNYGVRFFLKSLPGATSCG